MLDLASTLTAAWLFAWAGFAVVRLTQGARDSVYVLILVHVAFGGVPLALDVLVGMPSYRQQPGFYLASRDESTRWIYCVYVGVVPLIWYAIGRSGARAGSSIGPIDLSSGATRRLGVASAVLVALPIVAVAAAPDPGVYLEYGRHIHGRISSEAHGHHAIVNLAALLCVIGVSGLIFAAGRHGVAALAGALPFLAFAYWVHGKRNIVAISLLLFLSTFWMKRTLLGLRLIVAGILAALALAAFSLAYQRAVRGIDVTDGDFAYDNVRVDFGRDGGIKLAIFAELHPGRVRILEHRGQSLLFYSLMYVPRGLWPDKPWPYAVYLTSAMLEHRRPTPLGWTMSTSWLEEAIANLGWAGMAVGPVSLALFCRVGDRAGDEIVRWLTIVIASLLLVANFVAFAPLSVLWVAALIAATRRGRRRGATP